MSCAASRAQTSSTSPAKSIRSPISRSSTPSSRLPIWPRVEKAVDRAAKARKGGDKDALRKHALFERVKTQLDAVKPVRALRADARKSAATSASCNC